MVDRFYLDEDLPNALAFDLRALGHDAIHTRETGNRGQIDPKQLAFAARQNRILVTANSVDFRMLHEAWPVWFGDERPAGSLAHPGILVIPNPNSMVLAVMVRLLVEFSRGVGSGDLRNRLFRWRTVAGWGDLSPVR